METREPIEIFHSHAGARRQAFRNHRHSAFEISLILSGSGNYRVSERNYPIRSGDIFLYHTNEAHCITDIDEAPPMHILNIHFEPRYFWTSCPDASILQTFFLRSKAGENRLPAGDPLSKELAALILEADRENEEKHFGYADMIRTDVLRILILLARREREKNAQILSDPLPDFNKLSGISRSMDYVCAHFAEDLSLETIARISGLSRTYYCSVFKTLNGITPWEYVNMKRIERAMTLLRSGDGNVLDIALSCGFNSTANFNKIFLKITGLTPTEYKRSNQGT